MTLMPLSQFQQRRDLASWPSDNDFQGLGFHRAGRGILGGDVGTVPHGGIRSFLGIRSCIAQAAWSAGSLSDD